MSHEITNIDVQQGREMAWHKLTKVTPDLSLDNQTALAWDVVSVPLYRQIGDEFIKTQHCQLVCDDNAQIEVGKPFDCGTYGVISNADFLRIIREAMLSIRGATLESIGSVTGRNRTFASFKLKQLETFKAAGRAFVPFLTFQNSFDGSAPFSVVTSNICTVCNNTFGMNLRAVKGVKSGLASANANSDFGNVRAVLKHTKNVAERLENIPQIVDGFLGAQAEFRLALDAMDSRPADETTARAAFAGLLCKGEKRDAALSTRAENQVDRLASLFKSGRGNNGATVADAFQAVTEYATHESAGDSDNRFKQFVSSEYGSGADLKSRAFQSFRSPESFANLVTVGAYNLALN